MAYCEASDVRIYAPNIPDSVDLTGFIAASDGIIDANLRETFKTPLTAPSQFVKTIAGKLSAGNAVASLYAMKKASVLSERAEALINDAMAMLDKLKNDPGMDPSEKVGVDGLDGEESDVMVSTPTSSPIFDLGDPGGWGE